MTIIKKKLTVLWFLLPVIITLLTLTVYPTIVCVGLSLTSTELGQSLKLSSFVGLRNFRMLISDYAFWNSLKVSFIYTSICVVMEIALGIIIGLLLERYFKGQHLIRSFIFLPMMMTPVAVGLVWKSMLNYSYGIINYYLSYLGFTPKWLDNQFTAFVSVIIVDIWQWTPFVIIIVITGLSSLPLEPIEAALVDGASKWQLEIYVRLPLLRPLILVVLLIRISDSFKIFDNIYVLTTGGPGRATEVMSLLIYEKNFFYREVGNASAISLIMLVIAIGVSQLLIHVVRKERVIA